MRIYSYIKNNNTGLVLLNLNYVSRGSERENK